MIITTLSKMIEERFTEKELSLEVLGTSVDATKLRNLGYIANQLYQKHEQDQTKARSHIYRPHEILFKHPDKGEYNGLQTYDYLIRVISPMLNNGDSLPEKQKDVLRKGMPMINEVMLGWDHVAETHLEKYQAGENKEFPQWTKHWVDTRDKLIKAGLYSHSDTYLHTQKFKELIPSLNSNLVD